MGLVTSTRGVCLQQGNEQNNRNITPSRWYMVLILSFHAFSSKTFRSKASTDVEQRVKEIKKLHEHVQEGIEKVNSTYSAQANKHRRKKVFQLGS